MYSWEIQKLVQEKNELLSMKDYFELFRTSPQINDVRYIKEEEKFILSTDDNYKFKFKVYDLKKGVNNGK